MESSTKQWFVMRDLKRRNSNSLAIDELKQAGYEAFTPMTQMLITISGRQHRRTVPVIQDLLFVHETKERLDSFVDRCPTLQYRYVLGQPKDNPMTVRDVEMQRFILAVGKTESPLFYRPGEITRAMLGKKVRIIGGLLDGFEGNLLSVKGMRKRRLMVEITGLVTAAVEVQPEFIEVM